MGKLMVSLAQILPLYALISILLSGIASHPAHAQLKIDIRSVYTTDENQNNKNVFMPGDKINYHVDVENTTGSTFPIDIRFQAFDNGFSPDPRLYNYDQTYHLDQMPVGLSRFYNPTTLPSNTEISPNLYAARITITRSDCQGVDCAKDIAENTFTVQMTKAPEGKAPNLIVLVHGANTGTNDVGVLGEVANEIEKKIVDKTQWEVVVWDWHEYTPVLDITLPEGFRHAGDVAYQAANYQGAVLADAIKIHHYEHIHLIGHSAGAKLIHEAATAYIYDYFVRQQNPFIHLTFLDAYTPGNNKEVYGTLPADYPNHFSEQYVDRTNSLIGPWTNSCLSNAFNFDITNWDGADKSGFPWGDHQWPHRWYKLSVTSVDAWIKSGFTYGFPLSLEGGNNLINELAADYPPGEQCPLFNPETQISTLCIPSSCW